MRAGLAVVAAVLLLTGCAQDASVAAPTPGPDALHAYYQRRWFDVQDREPNLIPPRVDSADPVPDARWVSTVLACVADFQLAGGDRLQYDIGELTCEMQYPSVGGVELDYTERGRDEIYRHYDTVVLPCLRLGGQGVKPPPVFKDFSSDYRFSWYVPPESFRSTQRLFELARCGLRPASL